MSESKREHTVVFKTGKLYELDMASNVLQDEGMPFFKETESSSGVRLQIAMISEIEIAAGKTIISSG